jgi:hypothetical protein
LCCSSRAAPITSTLEAISYKIVCEENSNHHIKIKPEYYMCVCKYIV